MSSSEIVVDNPGEFSEDPLTKAFGEPPVNKLNCQLCKASVERLEVLHVRSSLLDVLRTFFLYVGHINSIHLAQKISKEFNATVLPAYNTAIQNAAHLTEEQKAKLVLTTLTPRAAHAHFAGECDKPKAGCFHVDDKVYSREKLMKEKLQWKTDFNKPGSFSF